MMDSETTYVVFQVAQRIAIGPLAEVAVAARHVGDPVLIFDRTTGKVIDLDLRGDDEAIRARYTPEPETARRGRPKLGVVAREVTLLPRHWDWLAQQPGGASVTLRKLIDAARKDGPDLKARTTAAYNVMFALAGDSPGFEEASRALFAHDHTTLTKHMADWPNDIRDEIWHHLSADQSHS
ncbi:DUF2239 family protein [Asticcacaulis sp. BYS171W]|uniref:DUF2239 family protein n=1 Tax=Asticcacaulis aquaticus TaxID=2984212 RepID=A0ABT5HY42_9CAUL|nr:DUF2239 family protein [Asticcacaulis aquaticus]MDC7684973.1 DUF2239 family protein [Asticcacaulis aquaticus]